ncbi:hypothetical protein B7463_g9972, partial [Scytalidium lignicola]
MAQQWDEWISSEEEQGGSCDSNRINQIQQNPDNWCYNTNEDQCYSPNGRCDDAWGHPIEEQPLSDSKEDWKSVCEVGLSSGDIDSASQEQTIGWPNHVTQTNCKDCMDFKDNDVEQDTAWSNMDIHDNKNPTDHHYETFEPGNWSNLGSTADRDVPLKEAPQVGSVSIPSELFEKLYLSRETVVKNDLRKPFGNPTPIALIGIIIALTPLSCDLMGWRGADSNGAAGVGSYFFFGGMLTMLGGILEFFLGNTFPAVVFTSFGAFYFSWAATLMPFFNAYGFYAMPGSTGQPMHPAGWDTVGFNSTMGFFFLFMDILCVVYLICALRTNLVFVFVLFTLIVGFGLIVGEYFQKSNAYGNEDPAALELVNRLEVAAGAMLCTTCLGVWYEFLAVMLQIMDFPFQLPVGDLSSNMKGKSDEERVEDSEVPSLGVTTKLKDCTDREKSQNLEVPSLDHPNKDRSDSLGW